MVNEEIDLAGSGLNPLWTYNAIKMSPREVALSFVPPPAFDALVRSDNAILTGPRGSGKTTLLKMLQSEALENWHHDNSALTRSLVTMTGVFIGVDRVWSEQLQAGDRVTSLDVGAAAYALRIGQSFTNAMLHRVRGAQVSSEQAHLRVGLSKSQEASVCASIARFFRLEFAPRTLVGINREFSSRLVGLGGLRRNASVPNQLPDWTHIDPFVAISAIAEEFNHYANEPDHKWALLFDELELAPRTVVDELLQHLRGNEPRLCFKLSMSPVHSNVSSLAGASGAVHGQDFEFVSLTRAEKQPSINFVKRIFEYNLRSRTPPVSVSPYRLLGHSAFDASDNLALVDPTDDESPLRESQDEPYRVGGAVWRRMDSLRLKDPSFDAYLQKHRIDLANLSEVSGPQRASRIRKMRNVVVVRDAFLDQRGGRRSRKDLQIYHGADSIMAIPDGNPRMAIALMKELFPILDGVAPTERVSPSRQTAAIESTINRFLALLRAQEAALVDDRLVSVLDLMDEVGVALARRILFDPFTADVALSFKVDVKVSAELHELIERAVNAGALIHVPQVGDTPLSSNVSGRVYRLSYLLAPRYGLPLRLGKFVSLSELLKPRESSGASLDHSQLTLFDDFGEDLLR